MLSPPMLESSLRTKSLAVSLVVHGTVVSAAVVCWYFGTRPPAHDRAQGLFTITLAVEDPPLFVVPTETESEDTPLPEEPDVLDPQEPDPREAADVPDDVPEPPPELATTQDAEPPPPHFLPPRAPFERIARTTDLRPARASESDVAEPARDQTAEAEPNGDERSADSPATALDPPHGPPVALGPTPTTTGNPLPDYPASWARRGWTGEVTIELDVTEGGRVSAARVLRSSGHPRLDELARSALEKWRFEPARDGGRAVAGTFRQRVEFRPNR